MIIGITGLLGAGKDTAADLLIKQGFTHISLSDMLREELKKKKVKENLPNLRKIGNELREMYGAGVLAERALKKVNDDQNFVITSIRNPAEVYVLQERNDFVLLFIDAPITDRYKRITSRKRAGDNLTFQEFKEIEQQQLQGEKNEQQLLVVKKLAKIIINNNETVDALEKKMYTLKDKLVKQYQKPRPSWDTYFFEIMDSVAKRATCDRGKSGCVIVKDKRILTTGYVGSPAGLPHCDEAGHYMHEVINSDGTKSKHCIRTVHAEQNAICQAAKNGISIDGGTMYTKMEPCRVCAMLIINAGIKRVVSKKRYHRAQDSREMFKQAGVKQEVVDDELETYANQ